ncbi:hypothetical protein ACQP3C_30795, partial [Escherichia coli]
FQFRIPLFSFSCSEYCKTSNVKWSKEECLYVAMGRCFGSTLGPTAVLSFFARRKKKPREPTA